MRIWNIEMIIKEKEAKKERYLKDRFRDQLDVEDSGKGFQDILVPLDCYNKMPKTG